MTFTERNFPPPQPAGDVIPDGVRVSLLGWLAQNRMGSPTQLWGTLCQYEGYGTFDEVAAEVARRFGQDASDHFLGEMNAHFKREQSRMSFAAGVDYNAEPAIRALPAPQFLDVLEIAIRNADYGGYRFAEEANRLFAKRGVNYRFSDAGEAEWHGDEGAYLAIVRPALDALRDNRMAGARAEFDAALAHLRSGSTKDVEDAVEETAKAVESAMKVVLAESGVTLKGKETARPLFDRMSKAGVVPAAADDAVLAASRIRNAFGGHGSGAQPREVPPGIAELAVRASASAICYLASRLP